MLEVAHWSILLQLDLDASESSQQLRNNNIDQYLEVFQQTQNLYRKERKRERERERERERVWEERAQYHKHTILQIRYSMYTC